MQQQRVRLKRHKGEESQPLSDLPGPETIQSPRLPEYPKLKSPLVAIKRTALPDLSLEIICHILSFLPLSQILKLDSLCHKLHDAVSLHLKLTTTIDFLEGQLWGWLPENLTDTSLACLLHRCHDLRLIYGFHPSLLFRRRQRGLSTSLSIPGVIAALTSCPNLRGVETSNIFLLEAVLSQLPNIHIIGNFKNRNGTGSFPIPSQNRITLPHNPRVTCLHLEGVVLPSLPRMDFVKELSLRWVQLTRLNPFREFSVPMLQTFVMRNCAGPANSIHYVPLITGLAAARFLTRLELVRVPFLGGLIQHVIEDSWRSRGFRQLQKIALGACKDAIESDLGYLLIACAQRLEEVCIQPSLTKDSLFSALNLAQVTFPHFETLHLGYMDNFPEQGKDVLSGHGLSDYVETPSLITDVGMNAVGHVFPLIQRLTIYKCPHLHLPVDWLIPSGGVIAWTSLKDLHLWRCHAVRLHDFCKLIPLLPALETIILEEMFREPPKGCSRVGLSAGTGLGVSSALVSNMENDVVNEDAANNNNNNEMVANQNAENPVVQDLNAEPHDAAVSDDEYVEIPEPSGNNPVKNEQSKSLDHPSSDKAKIDDEVAEKDHGKPVKIEDCAITNTEGSSNEKEVLVDMDGTASGSSSGKDDKENKMEIQDLIGVENNIDDADTDFLTQEVRELLDDIDFDEQMVDLSSEVLDIPGHKNVCTCTCGLEQNVLSSLTGSHNGSATGNQAETTNQTHCNKSSTTSEQVSSCSLSNSASKDSNEPSTSKSRSETSLGNQCEKNVGSSSRKSRESSRHLSESGTYDTTEKSGSIAQRTRSSQRKSVESKEICSNDNDSAKSEACPRGKGKSLHGKKKGLVKKSKCQSVSQEVSTSNQSCQAVSEEIRKSTKSIKKTEGQGDLRGNDSKWTSDRSTSKSHGAPGGSKSSSDEGGPKNGTGMSNNKTNASDNSGKWSSRKVIMVDRSTSTSDPVIEEDHKQVLSVKSSTLVSLTLRVVGITDLVIQDCPKLQMLSGTGCRVLKSVAASNTPRLSRVSFAQCRKLDHYRLVDEVSKLPGDRNRLVFLRPMQNYDAIAMETLMCMTGECEYHVCVLQDHSLNPGKTIHNRVRASTWLDLMTNINFELLKTHGFQEASRFQTAKMVYPWGRQLYSLQGVSNDSSHWDLLTDLPWLRELYQSSPKTSMKNYKEGVYCPRSMGHVNAQTCLPSLYPAIYEAKSCGLRLHSYALLVYVNTCDLNREPVPDPYL